MTGFIRPKLAPILALVWVLFSIAIIGFLPKIENTERNATDSLPQGADSTVVVELQEELPGSDVITAVVVIQKEDGSEFTFEEIGAAQALTAELQEFAAPGSNVTPVIPSESSTTLLVTVPVESTNDAILLGEVSDDIVETVETTLEDADATASVTGAVGFTADIARAFEGADFVLLGTTALIVALLLLVTYRSPILWLVPIVVVGLADQVAAKVAVNTSLLVGIPIDDSVTGILSVLVFGAGTNYALLLISRYRDELRLVDDRYEAMRRAWRGTFEAIFGAASTVALALLTLLLSAIPVTRGLGFTIAIGVIVALVYALFALPVALVTFNRGLFWPLVPKVGDALTYDRAGIWKRIGGFSLRRPIAMLVVGFVALAGLASAVINIQVGLAPNENFINKPESVLAAETLEEEFGSSINQSVIVITPAESEAEVTEILNGVDGVDTVAPTGTNGEITQVTAQLAVAEEDEEATVIEIREQLADVDETYVGGVIATKIDRNAAVLRDLALITPLILGLVLVVLLVLLRSVVASILLVVTVVSTYVAAMGAAWLVFQNVFGFPALADSVPLISFLFLVALGVDYNIFLATRARQESRTRGTAQGMLYALAATGGVITSAGILLAAVFAVLGVLPVIALTQIGVIVGIGVLLDTLLVRTILVPSLAFWLGDKFWWPRIPKAESGESRQAQPASVTT